MSTGTAWLTQWLFFQCLILDSTHHHKSGKYAFLHLCDLLVPWTMWSSRKGKVNKKLLKPMIIFMYKCKQQAWEWIFRKNLKMCKNGQKCLKKPKISRMGHKKTWIQVYTWRFSCLKQSQNRQKTSSERLLRYLFSHSINKHSSGCLYCIHSNSRPCPYKHLPIIHVFWSYKP